MYDQFDSGTETRQFQWILAMYSITDEPSGHCDGYRSSSSARPPEMLLQALLEQRAGQRERRQGRNRDGKAGIDREPGALREVGDRLLEEKSEEQQALAAIELHH